MENSQDQDFVETESQKAAFAQIADFIVPRFGIGLTQALKLDNGRCLLYLYMNEGEFAALASQCHPETLKKYLPR